MAKIKAVRTRQRGKTFSYAFEAGHDENGKRIVIEKGGFATRAEAYEKGTEAFVDFKHGNIGITSEKITVKDYLESWLNTVARANVKDLSFISYKSTVENQITPYIGNIILQELVPANIDSMFRKLVQKGNSYGTISLAKRVLSLALKYAVYPAQLIQSNPCLYVNVPKQAKRDCTQRIIVTQEKLKELLSVQKLGSPYYIVILLLYNTGMRIGEVLGLTWDRVDLDSGVITVDRQFQRYANKLISPKTKSSIRQVRIDEDFCHILQDWKSLQNEFSQVSGYVVSYEDSNRIIHEVSKELCPVQNQIPFVCTRKNGFLIRYSMLRNFFAKHGLNAHSFRHTHATLLIENGATPKGVAARLGHADIAITQNLYTHVTDKMQNDTLAVFTQLKNADK